MFGKLEIRIRAEGELNYQMSSLFHGALMELLSEEYAEFLHQSRVHPYSQHLEHRNGAWYWILCALNKDAIQQIFQEGILRVNRIFLKKPGIEVRFVDVRSEQISHRELAKWFYQAIGSRYLDIQFLTPAAFKQRGKYIFYPDMRCIYQSLMNKYDAVSEEVWLDEDALDELCEHTEVVRYDLKSTYFHLEGVRIPSFYGQMTIRIGGTQTMANFANLLLRFGEYSGIGVKASIGMGAIRINLKERTKRENDGKAD